MGFRRANIGTQAASQRLGGNVDVENYGTLLALDGLHPGLPGRYDRLAETLQLSMDVLHKDKCLLIFPEDNRLQQTL